MWKSLLMLSSAKLHQHVTLVSKAVFCSLVWNKYFINNTNDKSNLTLTWQKCISLAHGLTEKRIIRHIYSYSSVILSFFKHWRMSVFAKLYSPKTEITGVMGSLLQILNIGIIFWLKCILSFTQIISIIVFFLCVFLLQSTFTSTVSHQSQHEWWICQVHLSLPPRLHVDLLSPYPEADIFFVSCVLTLSRLCSGPLSEAGLFTAKRALCAVNMVVWVSPGTISCWVSLSLSHTHKHTEAGSTVTWQPQVSSWDVCHAAIPMPCRIESPRQR